MIWNPQPLFQGLHRPKGNLPHQAVGKSEEYLLCVRGIYGLPLLFDIETRELPKLSGIGRAGLHCIELRIECKQGSLSVGQLRTHPLLFWQRPCRHGSSPTNPQGIRQRPIHPWRFADLQRMQGLERILTETGWKKKASPIRQRSEQPVTEKEKRLSVIAHYNYTLRFRSCGLSRGD